MMISEYQVQLIQTQASTGKHIMTLCAYNIAYKTMAKTDTGVLRKRRAWLTSNAMSRHNKWQSTAEPTARTVYVLKRTHECTMSIPKQYITPRRPYIQLI